MRRARPQGWRVLAAGAVLAFLAVIAAILLFARFPSPIDRAPLAPPSVTPATPTAAAAPAGARSAVATRFVAPPGPRLRYPAGHRPALPLSDNEAREVSSVLNVAEAMRFGDFVWDDEGVPAGLVWVRIDLARQVISVFRGGDEIGTAVILYGTDGMPTPFGRFAVRHKDAAYHSRSYDAPMPYALFLTDDGVAIHASRVRRGFATHGCIGVPDAFARRLFAAVAEGDPVWILPPASRGAASPV